MQNTLAMNAQAVVTAANLGVQTDRDLAGIVAKFVRIGEGVVGHWVEYARGVLLFVLAPGDERSGEFYIYDRRRGSFWLLTLPDNVYGGYSPAEMRQKIKEFRLLDYAEDPSRLRALCS